MESSVLKSELGGQTHNSLICLVVQPPQDTLGTPPISPIPHIDQSSRSSVYFNQIRAQLQAMKELTPNSQSLLKPSNQTELKNSGVASQNGFLSDDENKRSRVNKSILKKHHQWSPDKTKEVHWGKNTICQLRNSVVSNSRRSKSDGSKKKKKGKEPQMAIPAVPHNTKQTEKNCVKAGHCQCSLF